MSGRLEHFFESYPKAKRQLLLAGITLFGKHGYGGVSHTELAKEAKVSKQLAIYHFSQPKEVLLKLAEIWSQTGQSTTIEYLASLVTVSPRDKIVGIAEGMFHWLKLYPEIARLTPVLFQGAQEDRAINKALSSTLDGGAERIKGFLAQDGQVRIKPQELEKRSKGIHSLMMGTALFIIATGRWKELDLYRAIAVNSIQSLLENT